MKKILITVLFVCLLAGCATGTAHSPATEAPVTQIGNPWKSYASMEEAQSASGLVFPLPEVVAEGYRAESFRVMNGRLMEVIYGDEDCEVIVRMQAGEDLDLSGVHGDADSSQTTEIDDVKITTRLIDDSCLHLISGDGYSYSLYAPNGYSEKAEEAFLSYFH